MNRILYIDIAKAIAIILVVIGHYIPDNHPQWYGDMRRIIYGFHMPLFMFASGFVYIATVKEESYHSFIWRKVKRLLIPYLVVSVLIISLKLITQGYAYMENPVTVISYVRLFYLPEAGYFTWFVWALWWMFVIMPFIDSKKKRLALLLLATILYFVPLQLPELFCLKEFKGMLIFFCLGCIVWDYKFFFRRFVSVSVYVYGVLFFGVNYVNIMNRSVNLGGANLIIPLIGIAFVVSVSKLIEMNYMGRGNRILLTIASSSYIIYLFHTTFEGFAKAIIFKIPILIDPQNDIMFVLGTIIVVSCGVIAPVVLDRYVLRKFKYAKILFGYK